MAYEDQIRKIYQVFEEMAPGEGVNILKQILKVNMQIESVGEGTEPNEGGKSAPDTILVEMLDKESFKFARSFNKSGFPIMDTYEIGFRADQGDRLQVVVPAIRADGGARYYRVWKTQDERINVESRPEEYPPLYINKSRTAKI